MFIKGQPVVQDDVFRLVAIYDHYAVETGPLQKETSSCLHVNDNVSVNVNNFQSRTVRSRYSVKISAHVRKKSLTEPIVSLLSR